MDVEQRQMKAAAPRTAGPNPPYPTHRFPGASKQRQEIGLPGHCERCAEVGHVKAHPSLGCGDVRCDKEHGPEATP